PGRRSPAPSCCAGTSGWTREPAGETPPASRAWAAGFPSPGRRGTGHRRRAAGSGQRTAGPGAPPGGGWCRTSADAPAGRRRSFHNRASARPPPGVPRSPSGAPAGGRRPAPGGSAPSARPGAATWGCPASPAEDRAPRGRRSSAPPGGRRSRRPAHGGPRGGPRRPRRRPPE
ncbi:NADPH-dependent FMN reductase-like domain-containing protein, partial [Dysosmobacter welbionis]